MKQPLKYALILFMITAICVGILGAVNQITAPIIAANDKKTEELAMQQLIVGSDFFEEISDVEADFVEKVYLAKCGSETAGYVVRVCPTGYGGTIAMLVGIGTDDTIKGIQILSHSETPGFGANAAKDSFKNQFREKTTPLQVSKSASGDDEIQAITGATITSMAVTEGVNGACQYVKDHQKEWE